MLCPTQKCEEEADNVDRGAETPSTTIPHRLPDAMAKLNATRPDHKLFGYSYSHTE